MRSSRTEMHDGNPNQASRTDLIFRNTFSRASSATIAQLLGLATIPLLLNKVSSTDFGLYTLGAAFVGYFSLLSLPARSATVKFVAEFGLHNVSKVREFASSTILMNVGVGVLMGMILGVIAHYCDTLFVIADEDVGKAKLILFAYALVAPINQPLSVFGSILLGLQDYRPTSVLDVVGAVIRAATIVLIYYLDGSILWLVFQELLFEILRNVLLGIFLSIRYDVSGFSRGQVRLDHFKKVLNYGGWSIGYVLSTMLIYQGTRVLVGVFVSVSAIAHFQIAYMLYNIVNTVSRYLQSAILPASSSAMVDGDHEFVDKLLVRGTRTTLCILLPVTLGIWILADPIISNWINPEYGREAAGLSQILVASWLAQGWILTAVEIYRGQRDIRAMSIIVIFGALCQIVLAIIFMRNFGIIGSAASIVIYYVVVTPFQMRVAAGKIGFRIGNLMVKSVVPVYIPAFLIAAALHFLNGGTSIPETALGTIICYVAILGFMSALLFRIAAPEEGRIIVGKILAAARVWSSAARN